MIEFWEDAFQQKGEMWGSAPAESAVLTNDFFVANGVKSVLIPGMGYGRNAVVFKNSGMTVSGIEISETALAIAQKHFGDAVTMYRGSVADMPFSNKQYDGLFCHGLLYLLDKAARAKFISDCYRQLTENGFMVFTAITKAAQSYGQGTPIEKDRFEMFGGVKIFFYDPETIAAEFENAGLFEITEVKENYPFYILKCKKSSTGSFKIEVF